MHKIVVSVFVLACAVVLTAAVAVLSIPPPVALAGQACQASLGPWPQAQAGGDAASLAPDQREIAGTIIGIGGQRGLPPRAWQIAIQAGMTESGLRNLKHGDRDSVGIFQMRTSQGWGSAEQLADVGYQVTTFYERMQQVPGWESRRPGDVAQAVERSGFPQRYHQYEGMAAQLVSTAGNVPDPSGCGGGEDGTAGGTAAAQKAIAAGKRWLGTPYAWGGGGPAGPSAGTAPDRGVTGFDCSSLVQHAYAQAGITLPRTSSQQYAAGSHTPVDQAQPGDLLFWSDSSGDPEAIHHVALYVGNNQMLEAPQSGDVVKLSQVRSKNLVANATRPGV